MQQDHLGELGGVEDLESGGGSHCCLGGEGGWMFGVVWVVARVA